MSFFDNLSGFAGDVGGFAGQLGQSIAQIGNAITQVQGAFGSGSASGSPAWGPGTPFVPPTSHTTNQPIGPPTHAPVSPLLLIGLAGLAIYIVAKK